MAGRGREHEPPAVPAAVGAVTGAIAFIQGLIVPQVGVVGHVVLGAVFGVVAVLSGFRAASISAKGRAARAWGRVGIVLGVLGLAMLVYQSVVILADGMIPPPFWAPYAR